MAPEPTGPSRSPSTSPLRLPTKHRPWPTRRSGPTCVTREITQAGVSCPPDRAAGRTGWLLVLVGVVVGWGACAADDDLVGLDPHGDVAFAGPVLGVDGIVLDRGIEPEAVAVLFAVIEGRLDLFAATASSTAATATATAWAAGAVPLGVLVAVTLVLGVGLLGLFLGGGGFDLRFDLVPQVDFARPGVLVVGREFVLLAELAQLGGGDFKLVGDPCVRAALVDPGADLVQLWLQRASWHRRASLLKAGGEAPAGLRDEHRERLEHGDRDDHHGHREAESQDTEADRAVVFDALDPARPRAVRGAAAELLAPPALE